MEIEICEDRERLLSSSNYLIVSGGPGSGKTTIALMKADKEVEGLSPGQKILFLSFARATVARVYESASQRIDKASLKNIQIDTYHSFFWNILRSHGYLINKNYPFKVLNSAGEAVKMSNIKKEERKEKRKHLFIEEGLVTFDLFAPLTRKILAESKKLRNIITKAYPTIILDEFQDTTQKQWEIVKLLGGESKIIALADPNQRIYGFAGADPKRISQFIEEFSPEKFNFKNQNYRSGGTDIAKFGNDIIAGKNKGKQYKNVEIIFYPPHRENQHEMCALKIEVWKGIARLKEGHNWSIAVLVPTKHQMLKTSNYFSSKEDGLAKIPHDVAIDSEGPELAGLLFAKLMERFESAEEIKQVIIEHLVNHIRGRGGGKLSKDNLKLSNALEKYLEENKIRGSKREDLIEEIKAISNKRVDLKFTGDPLDDWFSNVKLFNELTQHDSLKNIREDVRYVRLLHKGSKLRGQLSRSWKDHRYYKNASKIFENALREASFSLEDKKLSHINIMTMHKSKGKEFDEVFLFESYYNGRFVNLSKGSNSVEEAKSILMVGVTRAKKRATILTPKNKVCELL